MNSATGKDPIATITGFKGLWSRGAYESCPIDHLTDCQNCIFPGPGQVALRDSITKSTEIGGRTILSYFIATVSGGACLLTLNSNGNFYDETHATLLATIAGSPDDFTGLNIFGRTYISFKKQGKALAGDKTYYFDGVNFRAAGIAAPVAGPVLAQANPGVVDIGVHGVAISFQSTTGFLSKPGPITNINSTGSNDIELSSIPVGPAGTVARVILMTQSNQTELFFVPLGTINDNTTTTGTINIHDSALIASADYLNDILSVLPSCSSLRFYKGRMVLIGQDTFPDNIYVSNQLSPETINTVTGLISLPADYGINTTNTGLVINDVLYLMKPNGTYSTQDNGGDPSTWSVAVIDSGIGAWDNGITLFASSMSGADVSGLSFIASQRGLMLFNGTYTTVPLTHKIENIWRLISPNYFYKVNVAHDAWSKRVYIAVPLTPPVGQGTCNTATGTKIVTRLTGPAFYPGIVGLNLFLSSTPYIVASFTDKDHIVLATDPGNQSGAAWTVKYPGQVFSGVQIYNLCILMMDYSEGLDPLSVKWSVWDSNLFDYASTGITKMSMENFTLAYTLPPTPIYQLSFCNGGTTIFKVYPFSPIVQTVKVIQNADDTASGAHTNPINQYIITSQVGSNAGLFMFNLLNLSVFGYGSLFLSTLTKNRDVQTFLRTFSLISYNNQDLSRLINIVNENISICLQCDCSLTGNLNGTFQPTSIEIYGTKMWGMRAALNQSA